MHLHLHMSSHANCNRRCYSRLNSCLTPLTSNPSWQWEHSLGQMEHMNWASVLQNHWRTRQTVASEFRLNHSLAIQEFLKRVGNLPADATVCKLATWNGESNSLARDQYSPILRLLSVQSDPRIGTLAGWSTRRGQLAQWCYWCAKTDTISPPP